MKRRMIAFALVLSLLSIASVGFNGCGKGNTLVAITVTPTDPFIAKGTTRQLVVTAHFSDGKILIFWQQVTWQSSDPAVATVSSNGRITAVSEGTAVITAVDIAHPSITCSVTVTVTDLLSITITPSIVSIPVGTVQPFTATGTYSVLTSTLAPTNLTALVFWTSSNTAIAVISNVTPSQGIATAGTTTGTTTITATELATRITGTAITGTAMLTVVP